jgi:hypothetical protein
VLASTNNSDSLAEIHDLLNAAVSRQVGRSVSALPPLSFTTQTGLALLREQFSDVTLRTTEGPLSIPTPEPVLSYVASVREPILAWIGEPLDFDAVLGDLAGCVGQVIQAWGSFRATTRMGVFICR